MTSRDPIGAVGQYGRLS